MVIYYLIQCRKYLDSQHHLEQVVGRLGYNILKLLNNKAMFQHLFIYINETQQFYNIFEDVGLSKMSRVVLDNLGNTRIRITRSRQKS